MAGLFTILIAAGVEISPELQEFISRYGLYIAGFASMAMKDKSGVLQFFQKFIDKFIDKFMKNEQQIDEYHDSIT